MKKIIYFFLLISFAGCDDNRSDCSNVACTEEFKTIMVIVKDLDEIPVALDKFEVIDINSGEDITRNVGQAEFEMLKENGTYPLFGDEFVAKFLNSKTSVNFKGFDDGNEIVNSTYIVGADCCHVLLYEGDTNLIID